MSNESIASQINFGGKYKKKKPKDNKPKKPNESILKYFKDIFKDDNSG